MKKYQRRGDETKEMIRVGVKEECAENNCFRWKKRKDKKY